MPPAVITSIIGVLACEAGFIAGAILLAITGAAHDSGAAAEPARWRGLLFALVGGVCFLELGAPVGAMVHGHPFQRMQKPSGGVELVAFWLKRSSRHGYRMGVFIASVLPVLAGLRLQVPGIPGFLNGILAAIWTATVVWVLRGKSLFPAHQPLVGCAAAALSLVLALSSGAAFLQALSTLMLTVCLLAAALNLPQLLPLRTFASGAYFLAVLTILNSSRPAAVGFLVITAVAALLAHLARTRSTRTTSSAAANTDFASRTRRPPKVIEVE